MQCQQNLKLNTGCFKMTGPNFTSNKNKQKGQYKKGSHKKILIPQIWGVKVSGKKIILFTLLLR